MSNYENRIKALEAKVAEMARMQRHKVIPVEAKLVERIAEYQAENTRLQAEVERLRKFNDEALAHIAKEERKSRECLDMAQADVERLIKAGDKLVEAIQEMDVIIDMDSEHPEVNAWNAAKEASQA